MPFENGNILQLVILRGNPRDVRVTLSDFKTHEMYDKMDPRIYKQIVEGIIDRLEKNLTRFYR